MRAYTLDIAARRALLALTGFALVLSTGCELDPTSDCETVSNGPARDPANGFEVQHQNPNHCPVQVDINSGRYYPYSAKVRIIQNRQTDALSLSIQDALGAPLMPAADFIWTPDPNHAGKLVSEPQGTYLAGRVPSIFGVQQRDIAYNYVPLVTGELAEGAVYLTYFVPQLAINANDAYVGQPFSATVSPIGSAPVYPLSYEWHLDDVAVGWSQTYQTFFNDNSGHRLDVFVTDAAGHTEQTSMDIWALNAGNCDLPPCGL